MDENGSRKKKSYRKRTGNGKSGKEKYESGDEGKGKEEETEDNREKTDSKCSIRYQATYHIPQVTPSLHFLVIYQDTQHVTLQPLSLIPPHQL